VQMGFINVQETVRVIDIKKDESKAVAIAGGLLLRTLESPSKR
jgi:hypothetical protein